MLSAGKRIHRVRFERRGVGEKSPSGNVLQNWSAVVTCLAAFRPVFGREQVASGQPQSTLTGTLTTLSFAEAKAVTSADRVVFLAGPYAGRECQIRSIVPTPDAREIEFLIEHGPQT
ncbi:MAG TPA: head-tail adaptor protein [Bosea sp. (in: a-proteobacteria)]|jgi:SPP1 family predicted phage head-tail adaptor|nr:head-tail adaptor protein [Bosea sp. (in: a-proteobacteria)]